jgi:hypothetical protein
MGTTLPLLYLEVFENRVQRRIFASKRNEIAGGW